MRHSSILNCSLYFINNQAKPSNETHYFNDGIRRIDMVLAYQEADDKGRAKSKLEVFEKHLKEEGLEIETALKTVNDNKPNIILRIRWSV